MYNYNYISNILTISQLITINILYGIDINSILSFVFINLSYVVIILGIKVFIFLSVLVGNIIDIYIVGIIAVLIHWYLWYVLFGWVFTSFLLYLFLTTIEFFLLLLFYLESISSLFQSLTIANRLSINLLAGTLLITLLSLSSSLLINTLYYCLCIIFSLFLLFIFLFEVVNSIIQLLIFFLLSIEYSKLKK